MSITDELRRWVGIQVHETAQPMGRRAERELLAIADRIDEQHRKALEKVSAMMDGPSLDDLELRVSVIERKLNHRGDR